MIDRELWCWDGSLGRSTLGVEGPGLYTSQNKTSLDEDCPGKKLQLEVFFQYSIRLTGESYLLTTGEIYVHSEEGSGWHITAPSKYTASHLIIIKTCCSFYNYCHATRKEIEAWKGYIAIISRTHSFGGHTISETATLLNSTQFAIVRWKQTQTVLKWMSMAVF